MSKVVKHKPEPLPAVPVPRRAIADATVPIWARLRAFYIANRLNASALLLVLIVSVVYGLYVFGMASNLYVSESRFVIRQSREGASVDLDISGKSGSSGGTSSGASLPSEAAAARQALALAKGGTGGGADFEQNPFVIANYLMSRAFVQELMQQGLLQARFSRPSVDVLSRLPADATLEEAWRFWMRHAMAAVDRRANTIVIQVWGFTPEDARATVDLMVKRGEALLNEIETRGRTDALNRARVELDRANEEYTRKLQQISEIRSALATVDPKRAATVAQNSLIRFEGERIKMERELQVLKAAENANSPSANTLRLRAKSMVAEVGQLKDRITGYEADVRAAVNALAAYEELDLNRSFALTRVQIASLAVENAEILLRENSYFIYIFIAPSLPVEPAQEWRLQQWLLVTVMGLFAWLGVITFATLNRDSRF